MMHNQEEHDKIFRISELVVKHIKRTLSQEEQKELDGWLAHSKENEKLFERLVDAKRLEAAMEHFPSKNKQQAWENIVTKSGQSHDRKKTYGQFIRYAAAVLIVFSSWAFFKYWSSPSYDTATETEMAVVDSSVIHPGKNSAILTLEDGSVIVLDTAGDGEVTTQYGYTIRKLADGKLVYDLSGLDVDKLKAGYNTVTTPKGGEYQLVLADGTKVWLNAMSSLKFPTAFSDKKRRVELTGEGYFEVAEDKNKPFLVNAKDVEVEVLGTHFNISAFADEESIKTTLLEGSVRIKRGTQTGILKPGQEATAFDGKTGFVVQGADIDWTMAWKNGYFIFKDEPIESLMARISRWYNVDVAYEGRPKKDNTFGGKFSRHSNLSELLNSLELTGTIKFKTEGRRVTVML